LETALSIRAEWPPYHPTLASSIMKLNPKCATLADIDLPNGLHTHKRQRVPNEPNRTKRRQWNVLWT
jgi:hypothetical protein